MGVEPPFFSYTVSTGDFMIFRTKKPQHKRANRSPNFPYLFDPEPDEGKRFKKHHITITL